MELFLSVSSCGWGLHLDDDEDAKTCLEKWEPFSEPLAVSYSIGHFFRVLRVSA